MEEQQIELLLMSYSLEDILEDNDITQEYVVALLVEEGLINLRRYFSES